MTRSIRALAPLAVLAVSALLNAPPPAVAQTCGNGLVEAGEACDPPGSIACPPGSPAGAILACASDCTCPSTAPLDHFQCYRTKRSPNAVAVQDVTLVDAFGARTVDVTEAQQLYAPANKNGEDPTAPSHPGHLAAYGIRPQQIERIRDQVVVNQFGTTRVDLVAARALLVPTAKSLSGPPASPDGAFLNHFTCYDVRRSNGAPDLDPGTVTVQTQFETVSVNVKKPHRLCAPADKNGEDPSAPTDPGFLLCYDTKSKGDIGNPTVWLDNQFGQQVYTLGQRQELCVPTAVNPSNTTTTSTSSSSTSSSTSTSTTSSTAPSTSTTTTSTSTTTSSTGSASGAVL
jgi:hypothetical protein